MISVEELEHRAGRNFFPEQLAVLERVRQSNRVCLYYKTGSGKSLAAMAAIAQSETQVLIVAPPSTKASWQALAHQMGVHAMIVSHAKFRKANFGVARDIAIIVDEFHLLGGHQGLGWKRLSRIARGLMAPLLILSATPNYNDAERCYCVQFILDPIGTKGGFLQFLYQHCKTEPNPFGVIPKVSGFLHHVDAAGYLASLPNVLYVPDDAEYVIHDMEVPFSVPAEFTSHGVDRRVKRFMASLLEVRWRKLYRAYLDPDDTTFSEAMYERLAEYVGTLPEGAPVLMYCNSSRIAVALCKLLKANQVEARVVTGDTSLANKEAAIEAFCAGGVEVLVGTATLATGTDGMDQVCDDLIIVQDTDDNSLRRQLIGRILPRGDHDGSTYSKKRILRIVPVLE